MTVIKNVADTIAKLLTDKETEITKLTGLIKKQDATIKDLNEKMGYASVTGDTKAYLDAKEERIIQESIREMYTSRLDALKDKPLIADDDYNENVADIFKEIEDLNEKSRKKIAELSEQMNEEADKLLKSINDANAVFHDLQFVVCRDSSAPKKYTNMATVIWGRTGVEHYQYRLFKGDAE